MLPIYTCIVSVCNAYNEPSHKAELGTQILFGEQVEVLDNSGLWWHVRTINGGYEAWVLRNHLCKSLGVQQHVQLHHQQSSVLELASGASVHLPAASQINNAEALQCYGIENLPSSLIYKSADGLAQQIMTLAKSFLKVPYLWGGRTHQGIDCSGLITVVYKFVSINFKHEARAQILVGEEVPFLEQAQCGDIAFFADDEGEIVHVGIMLSANTIIHSSEYNGGVAIDIIDVHGIVNTTTGKHTHTLRIVKRVLKGT
jgi:gamma-D-glutamyl-L-lysine dipeptidyl-peptidase